MHGSEVRRACSAGSVRCLHYLWQMRHKNYAQLRLVMRGLARHAIGLGITPLVSRGAKVRGCQ
jgi:hypothetical protein